MTRNEDIYSFEREQSVEPLPDKPKGPGRPAKGYADLHLKVPPESDKLLTLIAETFDISKGEALAYVLKNYQQQVKRMAREMNT